MADDQMSLLRYLAAGQARTVAALDAQSKLLAQIIGIMTAEPEEPGDLVDSVRALVAICHDIKAGVDHIEQLIVEC